jgi:hypothetical protein
MTARALVTFVTAPAPQLPSLKGHLLRTMLHVALIVMVTMFSIFIGAALSTIFVSGVQ